jgi:flagellar basal-body rod protein FlgG
MNANQEKMDIISNNIVNSSTTAYKKAEIGFKDLLSESLDRNGVALNDKASVIGTGSKTSELYRDNSQGTLQETSITTDFAIDGAGYFKVISSNGNEAYTRDGSFEIDSMGKLVDTRGNIVELDYVGGYSEENVKFTKNNILVDKSGQVFIKELDNFNKVADLPVYNSVGDRAFISMGNNLFYPVEGVEVERTNNYDILQGMLEGSNVNIAEEMSEMIVTQRAFELSTKGITTADEMWQMINNMRR